jgi:4-diphosphocytidyl-2-C-methyl-D-erythritol kinase
MMTRLSLAAPAKLNLYLHVTGRRDDGYHTLVSLIGFTGLYDTVTVTTNNRAHFALVLDGPQASGLGGGTADENLAIRAARALAPFAGADAGAEIHLTKRIPVAAGLGGGSADAAAVLLALDRLWQLGRGDLAEIGLRLGADVPVCLQSRTALVGGIGEELTPLSPLPAMGLVMTNPGHALETARVFAALNEVGAEFGARVPAPRGPFADGAAFLRELRSTGNDLARPACSLAPVVKEVLAGLAALPGCRRARMSGSGASCFGLFDDVASAQAARAVFARLHPGWWSWAGGFRDGRADLDVAASP